MNRLKIASSGPAVAIWGLTLPILIALPLALGCGKAGPPPSDGRLAIEGIAKWRTLYLAQHNRQPPPDEKAFVDFMEKISKERGEPFDRDTALVSPRDKQKYVVRYGKESAKLKETDVVVHEQEGYDGKVLVAYEMARSAEVDAAEIPTLFSPKP